MISAQHIRAIMAKIKLPKKPLSMVIFQIKVRGSHRDLTQGEIRRFRPRFYNGYVTEIEVTSWLVSADDFSSRVARGANE